MPLSAPITPLDALVGDVDLDDVIDATPDDFRLRGLFFETVVKKLGDRYDSLRARLRAPPPGRYLPFRDYPMADYSLLMAEAARVQFPRRGLREAIRRLSRSDFETFRGSVLGKVMVALVSDPRSTLHKLPTVYAKVAPGPWSCRVWDETQSVLGVEFDNYHGTWEYQLGQLEGIVSSFGCIPRTRIHESGKTIRFLVQYTD